MSTHYTTRRPAGSLTMNKKMYFFIRNSCELYNKDTLYYLIHKKSGEAVAVRAYPGGTWVSSVATKDELIQIGYTINPMDKFNFIILTASCTRAIYLEHFQDSVKICSAFLTGELGITEEDINSIILTEN